MKYIINSFDVVNLESLVTVATCIETTHLVGILSQPFVQSCESFLYPHARVAGEGKGHDGINHIKDALVFRQDVVHSLREDQ